MPRRRIGTQIYSLVYHNLPPFSSINIKSHKNVLFCRRKELAKDGRRRARTVPETTESGRYRPFPSDRMEPPFVTSRPFPRPQETAFRHSPPFSHRPQETSFCRSPPFSTPTTGNRLSPHPAPEKIRPRRPPKPPKAEIFIAYKPPPKIGISQSTPPLFHRSPTLRSPCRPFPKPPKTEIFTPPPTAAFQTSRNPEYRTDKNRTATCNILRIRGLFSENILSGTRCRRQFVKKY